MTLKVLAIAHALPAYTPAMAIKTAVKKKKVAS